LAYCRVISLVQGKFYKAGGFTLGGYLLLWWMTLQLRPAVMAFVGSALLIWSIFCSWRLLRGIRRQHYRANAAAWDREAFGFNLGAVVATAVLIPAYLLTPVYVR
jgi:hypothetical protein